MKIALIDGKKTKVNLSERKAVNFRNLVLLKNELNAELLTSYEDLKRNINTIYDVVILGFGSPSTEINITKNIINNSKKAIFISGEYEQQTSPPLWYSNKNYDVVKNYESLGKLAGKTNGRILKTYELNLNLLIAKEPNQLSEKKYDCVYYGRWREDRAKYFKKYIQNGMYLSTSTKNMKKFKHAGCNPKYLDTISWEERKETLNLFRYSLYIEDEYTHNVFNNLANRWYEAGFCNNVVFFDVNCWNTIRKSEIAYFEEQIKDYIVSSHDELQAKIEYCNQDFERHLAIQKGWRLNQMVLRQDMINELKRIIENRD
jgi:hypothetical protein